MAPYFRELGKEEKEKNNNNGNLKNNNNWIMEHHTTKHLYCINENRTRMSKPNPNGILHLISGHVEAK